MLSIIGAFCAVCGFLAWGLGLVLPDELPLQAILATSTALGCCFFFLGRNNLARQR